MSLRLPAVLAAALLLPAGAGAAPAPSLQGLQTGVWNHISDNDHNPNQAVTGFGDVNVGSTFLRQYRLRNVGDGFFSWTGASSPDGQFEFLKTDRTPLGFPIPITGGDHRDFLVRFTPTTPGTTSPVLTLTTSLSGLNAEYTFAVTGTGRAPDARISGRPQDSGGYDNITDGETIPRTSEGTLFVMTPVGSFTERFFKLTNDGNTTLDPGSAFMSGTHASQFSIRGLSLGNLAPGNHRTFEIRFTPTSTGTKTATFNLVSDDPDENPYTFRVQAEGVAFPNINVQGREDGVWNDIGDFDLNPDQAVTRFGDVRTGQVGTRVYRIQNTGNAALDITSVTSSNPVFTIPGPPTAVPAGESREFSITFAPTAAGARNTTITVRSDVPGDADPYTFALTGTGIVPDARISGRPQDSGGYDNITDGETNPTTSEGTLFVMTPVGSFTERFFKLTNDGNTALDPGSAFMSGTHASQFDIRGLSLGNLAAGANRTFEIRFRPTSTGTKTATFNLVSDDPDENPYTFVVRGEAVAFPNINVQGRENGLWYTIDDGDLDPDQDVTRFGAVDLGQSSPRVYRIQNTGNAALNIASLTSSNPVFTVPGPPTTVPAGGSVEFVINFTPTSRFATSTTITVRSDVPGDADPYTFILTGRGTGPEIVIDWVDRDGTVVHVPDGTDRPDPRNGTRFADTTVSGDATEHIFRVRNTGDKNLRITGRSFTGSGAAHFSVSGLFAGNPFATLKPHQGRNFIVAFEPSSAGSKLATFSVESNDGDENPYTIVVQGVGVAEPDIRVRGITEVGPSRIPTDIADGDLDPDQDVTRYGDVNPGTTATRLFRIVNDGTATLNIASVTSSDPQFFIPGPPLAVDPGDHTDFVIDFEPATTGTHTATITVESDDPDAESTYTFAITGTGSGPEIEVFSRVNIVGTDPFELTGGQTGPSPETGTDFGSRNVGAGGTPANYRAFRIVNTGTENLRLNSARFSGSGADHFTLVDLSTGPLSRAIPPRTATLFQIGFDPASAGSKLATLVIANNDGDEDPFTFQVRGTGVEAPMLELAWPGSPDVPVADGDQVPSAADGTLFPAADVDGGEITHTFEVHNPGSAVLDISAITVDPPSHFTTSGVPAIVGARATGTFDLTFDPDAGGWHEATVTIHSNAWTDLDAYFGEPQAAAYTFAVSGFGYDQNDTPIRAGGRFNDEWVFSTTNTTFNFYPFWHPVDHDDPDTGTFNGTDFQTVQDRPGLLITSFGNLEPTETSYFRLWNEGDRAVRIDALVVDSSHYHLEGNSLVPSSGTWLRDGDGNITLSNPKPGADDAAYLSPGDHFTFALTFAPWLYGRHDATVTVHTDAAAENPFIIRVTGFADNAESGPEIVFRNHGHDIRALPGETRTRSVTIGNDGNEILTLDNPSSDNAAFEVLGFPAFLAPGQTGDLEVRYTASATSTDRVTAAISIGTNDPDGEEDPATFTIGGQPGVPAIVVLPGTGNKYLNGAIPNGQDTPAGSYGTEFGAAHPDAAPVTRTFEIINDSEHADLNITLISTGSPGFTVDSAPATVAHGAPQPLTITYHPDGNGRQESTVTILSDDPDNPTFTFAIGGTSTGDSPPPDITDLWFAGGNLVLTFNSSATETYSVWVSLDLDTWDPVPGHLGIPGTGQEITRSLVGYGAGTRIFVQVRQDPET